MRTLTFWAFAVAGVMLFAGGAQAGIIDWNPEWTDSTPLDLDNSGWLAFDYDTNTWTVWENYVAGESDWAAVSCVGGTDSDPLIHVVKTVTNDSTFVWTDYHIEISGSEGVSYVSGSATSDVFNTIIESGGTIDFYAPNSVPIGGDVTFEFDIIIPAGGFSFDISQTPTPEPGTIVLLSLGALALIRRRRR